MTLSLRDQEQIVARVLRMTNDPHVIDSLRRMHEPRAAFTNFQGASGRLDQNEPERVWSGSTGQIDQDGNAIYHEFGVPELAIGSTGQIDQDSNALYHEFGVPELAIGVPSPADDSVFVSDSPQNRDDNPQDRDDSPQELVDSPQDEAEGETHEVRAPMETGIFEQLIVDGPRSRSIGVSWVGGRSMDHDPRNIVLKSINGDLDGILTHIGEIVGVVGIFDNHVFTTSYANQLQGMVKEYTTEISAIHMMLEKAIAADASIARVRQIRVYSFKVLGRLRSEWWQMESKVKSLTAEIGGDTKFEMDDGDDDEFEILEKELFAPKRRIKVKGGNMSSTRSTSSASASVPVHKYDENNEPLAKLRRVNQQVFNVDSPSDLD